MAFVTNEVTLLQTRITTRITISEEMCHHRVTALLLKAKNVVKEKLESNTTAQRQHDTTQHYHTNITKKRGKWQKK